MRHEEGKEDRGLAYLGGHAQADEHPCQEGVPEPPLLRDPIHEVERRDGAKPQDRVDSVEMAKLDVYHGQRHQGGRQHTLPAPVHAAPQKIDHHHYADIRQGGDEPSSDPQVIHLGARPGRVYGLYPFEQVEGEAAIGEPARIPGALVGVEKQADLTQRWRRQLGNVRENRPLVRVRGVPVPLVPFEPVEAQP